MADLERIGQTCTRNSRMRLALALWLNAVPLSARRGLHAESRTTSSFRHQPGSPHRRRRADGRGCHPELPRTDRRTRAGGAGVEPSRRRSGVGQGARARPGEAEDRCCAACRSASRTSSTPPTCRRLTARRFMSAGGPPTTPAPRHCRARRAASCSARRSRPNSPIGSPARRPTRTIPISRRAARRAARRRRSPISWCRSRSARKPAAR